jgi:ATP-dependent Clp protease ATP-binding subunit ClpB
MSYLGFNAGENEVNSQSQQEESFRDKVRESLRQTFKPEFLNRLDEVIIFNSLRPKDIALIVDIQLEQVKEKLAERRIKLTVDSSLKKYLIDNGFDPEYGARPIKRLIQKIILDNLADKIIKGDVKDGQKIKLSFRQQAVEVSAS